MADYGRAADDFAYFITQNTGHFVALCHLVVGSLVNAFGLLTKPDVLCKVRVAT